MKEEPVKTLLLSDGRLLAYFICDDEGIWQEILLTLRDGNGGLNKG